MSLADYWDDGGNFLREGKYEVVVASHKSVEFNSGNKGVEFTLRNEQGQTTATFVLVQNSLWRLAQFAKACGLTKEEARSYDEHNPSTHAILHNRRLNVTVISEQKGNKTYHSADEFWACDGSAPPQAAAPPTIPGWTPPPASATPF